MNHYSSMDTYYYGNRSSAPHEAQRRPPYHEVPREDFIPMPTSSIHHYPAFGGTGREGYYNPHQAHGQHPPPGCPYQHPRADPPQFQEHALNEPRGTNLEVMLEEFMEGQREFNRNLESRLEFLRFDIDGKFGKLSSQIENLEQKHQRFEEELQKLDQLIKENTKKLDFAKLTTKEMDELLDEKITNLDGDLSSTTESLNTIALIAHKAKKDVAEVSLKERQCYSTMLTLVEGQKQMKVINRDLRFAMDKRYHDILGQSLGMEEKVDKMLRDLKTLATRLEYIEGKDTAAQTTSPKHQEALVVYSVREVFPRRIWREVGSSSTSYQEGKAPKEDTMLRPNSRRPTTPVEERIERERTKEMVDYFNTMVRRFPLNMGFEEACRRSPPLREFVLKHKGNNEIGIMYEEARLGIPRPRTLLKLQEPGCFFIHFSIDGVTFGDALCDSGASVNLMSEEVAKELGLMETMRPAYRGLRLADNSQSMPLGEIENVPLNFGNCIVPCDFYVMFMHKGKDTGLLLGRAFLATAGAIMDWPNRRISLANVDKETFYSAAPPGFSSKRIRYTNEDATARVECLPLGHHLKTSQQDEALPDSSRRRRAEKPPTEPQT